MNDSIKITGDVSIVLIDEHSNIVKTCDVKNLVVHTGKTLIARRLAGLNTGISVVPSHMAIGSNNSTPLSGNTTLGTENGRVALTSTSVSENIVSYNATFGPGIPASGSININEAGILNAASNGELLNRVIFPTFSKSSTDTLIINWSVKVN